MDSTYNSYIYEVINKILLMQRADNDLDIVSCDKLVLGSSMNEKFNTRPISIYNKFTSLPWTFTYNLNGTNQSSEYFRIEDFINDSVIVRILTYNPNDNIYSSTNFFATISLSSIGAIRCYSDTFINL